MFNNCVKIAPFFRGRGGGYVALFRGGVLSQVPEAGPPPHEQRPVRGDPGTCGTQIHAGSPIACSGDSWVQYGRFATNYTQKLCGPGADRK